MLAKQYLQNRCIDKGRCLLNSAFQGRMKPHPSFFLFPIIFLQVCWRPMRSAEGVGVHPGNDCLFFNHLERTAFNCWQNDRLTVHYRTANSSIIQDDGIVLLLTT